MLPYRITPAKQETLRSFVRRSAAANDLTPAIVLRSVDEVDTQSLSTRKQFPLAELSRVLGLEEVALESMCPRQHRHALGFASVRVPRYVRWTCPQCEHEGIETFENCTWLRFSCEEHGTLLVDSRPNRATNSTLSSRRRKRQARINAALTGPTRLVYEDEISRLLDLIRNMKTLATKVEISSTPTECHKLLNWIKDNDIDVKFPEHSPSHAAKLLDLFWAPVSMATIHSAIDDLLRSLDLPALRQRKKPHAAEFPELIGEIVELFQLAWQIERIADEKNLDPAHIPGMYVRSDDPDWLAQRRNRQFPKGVVEHFWRDRLLGCALLRGALIELGAQLRGIDRRLSDYPDNWLLVRYHTSRIVPPEEPQPHHFAAGLARLLLNDDRAKWTSHNLPVPAAQLKTIAPEEFAEPKGRARLEKWLWLASLRDTCPYFYGPQMSLTEILDLDDKLTDLKKVALFDSVANASPRISDVVPHSSRQHPQSIEA